MPSRRQFVSTVLLASPMLSGCLETASSEGTGNCPVTYSVHAIESQSKVPDDAVVVPVDDKRISNIQLLQQAISELQNHSNPDVEGVSIKINESQFDSVNNALGETPLYTHTDNRYSNDTGLYVNTTTGVVWIMTTSGQPACAGD